MARYVILPERSRLWADARSTLHPIRVETGALSGSLEAEIVDGEVRLGLPTRLELEVAGLSSGNALMDSELRRKLEARRFPRIAGELREVTPLAAGRAALRADLTLHGVTRSLTVEISARPAPGDLLELEGERVIDMREFGLRPPRILMLKVEPEVRVRARLLARRAPPG